MININRQVQRKPNSSRSLFEDYAKYVNPTFIKLLNIWGYGREYVRAKDIWIWDNDNNRYMDFLSGFGVANIGHNHPEIQDAVTRFMHRETLQFNHIAPNPYQADLARRLANLLPAPLQMSLFSNSGAEAVEAAMKLARCATGKSAFVYCQHGYHGTSFATLSVMGDERMRKPLQPLLSDCIAVEFNNIEALWQALQHNRVAAFIVEPIQGEGGLNIPSDDYLRQAYQLCKQHQCLLVVDEIQTGFGRCGDMFAFQRSGIVPDVVLLGKSLSGGLMPIAAAVTSEKWFNKAFSRLDRFDLHSSTFAGNSLACFIAEECIKILQNEDLASNSQQRGEQLLNGLKQNLDSHPFVASIRGRGLYVAIEFGNTLNGAVNWMLARSLKLDFHQIYGQWIALKLLEAGIICQPAAASWNVIKFMPPLSIGESDINSAIATITRVINAYDSSARVIKESGLRMLGRNKSQQQSFKINSQAVLSPSRPGSRKNGERI